MSGERAGEPAPGGAQTIRLAVEARRDIADELRRLTVLTARLARRFREAQTDPIPAEVEQLALIVLRLGGSVAQLSAALKIRGEQ